MKFFARTAAVVAIAAGASLFASVPATADTPGCVSEREYLTVFRHETNTSVHDHFDTAGVLVDEYWGAGGLDSVRSYRKCPGFDGGRGRVGVNFDNYSHDGAGYFDNRMRLYRKVRYNPYNLLWWW